MIVGSASAANSAVAPPMRSECAPKCSGCWPTEAMSALTWLRTTVVVSARRSPPGAPVRNSG
eukprot:2755495-Prymnesium_polylepis.1